eukprot:CAMPEP_0113944530 /NCGR_PEP_ID=MMETSP1339-20121228/34482_1 /TAXON_ID=94617 /ORGANISM="Fibrocapsa japonica" /LENGTH=97 /DNA_ID=CAMNT_0000949763 /DNA_START=50 /DNA_END=343 /DNA_ORIENTATION=+ /assembly_acc=CAM_ASM_000762
MESSTDTCYHLLVNKKFDITTGGSPNLGVWWRFKDDGLVECNQIMFDKQPWRATNKTQFELQRKNGSWVLWQWSDKEGNEAFRTDKKVYGMRLAKVQ